MKSLDYLRLIIKLRIIGLKTEGSYFFTKSLTTNNMNSLYLIELPYYKKSVNIDKYKYPSQDNFINNYNLLLFLTKNSNYIDT